MAAMTISSGRMVSTSFMLWTAKSITPSARARSSSLVQSALPPMSASGRSCMRSPSVRRSEEHTSELQSLMRISYAVFCLKKKNQETRDDTMNTYQIDRTDDRSQNNYTSIHHYG